MTTTCTTGCRAHLNAEILPIAISHLGPLGWDAPVKQRRGHIAAHIPPIWIAGARPTAARVDGTLQAHADSEGERLLGRTAVQRKWLMALCRVPPQP